MKRLQLSKSSWHYWVITHNPFFGEQDAPNNLCGYFWAVIFCCLLLLVFSFITITLFGMLSSGLVYAVRYIMGLVSRYPYGWEVAGMFLLAIGMLIAGLSFLILRIKKYLSDTKEEKKRLKSINPSVYKEPKVKKPSFIKEMYKSWKEKTCYLIEFKTENELRNKDGIL